MSVTYTHIYKYPMAKNNTFKCITISFKMYYLDYNNYIIF